MLQRITGSVSLYSDFSRRLTFSSSLNQGPHFQVTSVFTIKHSSNAQASVIVAHQTFKFIPEMKRVILLREDMKTLDYLSSFSCWANPLDTFMKSPRLQKKLTKKLKSTGLYYFSGM